MATKYTDPKYDELDAQTTERLGLPEGLLQAVRVKGERSNSDQVSEAGAKTVWQITPQTRKLILDKYGIDPYLNEKNASLGAGYLLEESLDRNKGDTKLAVAEYHGGTDRSNWGPRTRAYVGRVTGESLGGGAPAQSTGSRSLRAELAASQPQQSAISQAYAAYKNGTMPADVAQEFENDVNAGKVLLPAGATLKPAAVQRASTQQVSQQQAQPQAQQQPGAPIQIPQEAAQAYANGTMPADVRAEMEADIKSGRAVLPQLPLGEDIMRGLGLGTRNLIEGIGQGAGAFYNPIAATINAVVPNAQIPTLEGQAKSTADRLGLPTALTPTEQILATVQQMAASNIPTIGAGQALQATKAAPAAVREAGAILSANPVQQVVSGATAGAASEAAKAAGADTLGQTLAAVGGGMGPALVQGTARQVAQSPTAARVVEATQGAAQATGTAIKNTAQRAAGAVGMGGDDAARAGRNVGAAETEVSAMRRANAADLPVPIENLTKGQATREFGQQQFEREAAKNAELGAPIREALSDQNIKVQQNLDAFIDASGSQATDLRGAGIAVDKAVRDSAARAKNEIRVAYKNAEKSAEGMAPVSTQPVVDLLNNSVSATSTAPILTTARKELIRLGGAVEDDAGNLVARDMALKDAEQMRKLINASVDASPSNIKFGRDVKEAIDSATEGAGGELYNRARRLRAKFAKEYENRAVISDLLTRKRGSDDRRVAFEDVVDRVVNRGSLDDVRFARKILQTGGEEGKQAWKEIQGAVLNNIKEQATKNVARDEAGNAIISPASLDKAIKKLESDGKLDFIFGKRGAEQLRTLNDVSKTLFTAPPGSVNTSNTASILLAAMDAILVSQTGIPAPLLSLAKYAQKNIKDRKLRARVRDAIAQPKQEKF